MQWTAIIFGPAETLFKDETFKLVFEFEKTYRNKPPTVRFVSKMWHDVEFDTKY